MLIGSILLSSTQEGEPNEDFYWAVNRRSKIYEPVHNVFERIIDKSYLLEFALVRMVVANSSGIPQIALEDMDY